MKKVLIGCNRLGDPRRAKRSYQIAKVELFWRNWDGRAAFGYFILDQLRLRVAPNNETRSFLELMFYSIAVISAFLLPRRNHHCQSV